MHEYLHQFTQKEENAGIFVFSVIPGTVDTPANRTLIEVGTPELSQSKLDERNSGRERDANVIGRIIAKMSTLRKKFNSDTHEYDIDIENGEIVEISNQTYEFEKKIQ